MPTPPAAPSLVRELIIAVVGCYIFYALGQAYRWLKDWAASFDNKWAAKEFEIMVRLGPGYADLMLRKMRETLCRAAYFLCCAILIYMTEWPGMRPLVCILTMTAAYLSARAINHAGASTIEGSEGRMTRFQKRLRVVEKSAVTTDPDI